MANTPLLRFPTPTECTSSFEYTRCYEAIASQKTCKKGDFVRRTSPLVHNTWSSGAVFTAYASKNVLANLLHDAATQ